MAINGLVRMTDSNLNPTKIFLPNPFAKQNPKISKDLPPSSGVGCPAFPLHHAASWSLFPLSLVLAATPIHSSTRRASMAKRAVAAV